MTTTTVEREVYSELGQLAAAFRIEARRHLSRPIRDTLEDVARELSAVRVRYWSGKMSTAAALGALLAGEEIIGAVAAWDA